MSTDRPLLAPGNEAEWARINREEDGQRRAIAKSLTPSQRIAHGQKLSQQAVSESAPVAGLRSIVGF